MVAISVALTFVCLVLMDLGIEKWKAWRVAHPAPAGGAGVEAMAHGYEGLCQVPEGVYISGQHTWAKRDPDGGLEIGADALLVRAVGVVRQISLPQVGDLVTAGQPLCRLEHNGSGVTIRSALTGRVMAINSRLADRPELLSSDPYGSGWLCRLSPAGGDEVTPNLRFGQQAAIWLENEFARLREFIFGHTSPDLALGVTSQDGGLPAVGCLGELGPTAWSAFEAKFLHHP